MTFKFILKGYEKKDKTKKVYLRVTQKRDRKYLPTSYHLEDGQLDDAGNVINHPRSDKLNLDLLKLKIETQEDLFSIPNYANKKIDEILNELENQKKEFKSICFFEWSELKQQELKDRRKDSTAEVYFYSSLSLEKFTGKPLYISEISYSLLKRYETWLYKNGSAVNGVAHNLKTIRAIYRSALKEGYGSWDKYAFRDFGIKMEQTEHRHISKEDMRKLIEFKADPEDKEHKHTEYARDVFLLMFALIGINVKDLYYLEPPKKGRYDYRRSKQAGLFSISIPQEAKHLIEKFKDKEKAFNFHKRFKDFKSLTKLVNKKLKVIAKSDQCNIQEPLSTYYSRHTWATIGINNEVQREVISAALGHDQKDVTGIYAEVNKKLIDEANNRIHKLVYETEKAPDLSEAL